MNIRSIVKNIYDSLPNPVRRAVRSTMPVLFTEPLIKQLPLDVPQSIHIDTVNLCNFKCTFCPTGDSSLLKEFNRPKGMMDFDLFKKIIDDLKIIVDKSGQKVIELHLYKDGEPLIHPRLGEMITYAKFKEVALSVETTTNGALLTEEKAIELLESGLDALRISVEHVSDEGYKNVTANYSDYQKIIDNVRFLFEERTRRKSKMFIHTKILDVDLTEEEIDKFINDFGPISDKADINQLMGWSNTEAKDFTLGVDVERGMGGKTRLQYRHICPEPFRSLAVNFNGHVSVCCVDWSYGTIVGDVNKESLEEIIHGKKLNDFRISHIIGERHKIKACADCHYILGFADHLYLDNYKRKLIKKYLLN